MPLLKPLPKVTFLVFLLVCQTKAIIIIFYCNDKPLLVSQRFGLVLFILEKGKILNTKEPSPSPAHTQNTLACVGAFLFLANVTHTVLAEKLEWVSELVCISLSSNSPAAFWMLKILAKEPNACVCLCVQTHVFSPRKGEREHMEVTAFGKR